MNRIEFPSTHQRETSLIEKHLGLFGLPKQNKGDRNRDRGERTEEASSTASSQLLHQSQARFCTWKKRNSRYFSTLDFNCKESSRGRSAMRSVWLRKITVSLNEICSITVSFKLFLFVPKHLWWRLEIGSCQPSFTTRSGNRCRRLQIPC